MAKHNDQEFQRKIQASFRANLEKQLKNGIAQGVYAACKIIFDKASAEDKSPEDKLHEIIAFCNIAINDKEAKERKLKKEGD